MKLKINKACDINSISVLPPHTRRSSAVYAGPVTSILGGGQASQLRSQTSQQSLSQGVSSQHGMLSQLSQNSLDEVVTNDQRFGSQERDTSMKKISCLAPIAYSREESQMPISRSSTNLMRKWSSTSVSDHKCQISEELEHKIAMMETSLSRFGMILDSVQGDIMQVNKGTKELSLELEAIRQKSIMQEDSIRLLNRGQGDIRDILDVGFKSITDQLSKSADQDKLRETMSVVLNLPEHVEACLQKLKNELWRYFSREFQATSCNLKTLNNKNLAPVVLPVKASSDSSSQMSLLKSGAVPTKVLKQAPVVPKIEMGSWNSVKAEQASFLKVNSSMEPNKRRVPSTEQDRELRGLIDLDEDIDGDFSCFILENETENHLINEAKQETERILRKARRRKRRHCNTIILN
ncbi:hypothetical protein Nepgr_024308 [Nepenthes gracilis]|uniref:Protein PAIR1 n=1 Tax=Nepenthes gracilis TaxID=150966 RepID=A0AAD3T411_NEPGR|nr:hypothetical protein Nepgr_024308 [Nepenthes gracilis]